MTRKKTKKINGGSEVKKTYTLKMEYRSINGQAQEYHAELFFNQPDTERITK